MTTLPYLCFIFFNMTHNRTRNWNITIMSRLVSFPNIIAVNRVAMQQHKWVIPCHLSQFAESLCADWPRFAQFGNILLVKCWTMKQIRDSARMATWTLDRQRLKWDLIRAHHWVGGSANSCLHLPQSGKHRGNGISGTQRYTWIKYAIFCRKRSHSSPWVNKLARCLDESAWKMMHFSSRYFPQLLICIHKKPLYELSQKITHK